MDNDNDNDIYVVINVHEEDGNVHVETMGTGLKYSEAVIYFVDKFGEIFEYVGGYTICKKVHEYGTAFILKATG